MGWLEVKTKQISPEISWSQNELLQGWGTWEVDSTHPGAQGDRRWAQIQTHREPMKVTHLWSAENSKIQVHGKVLLVSQSHLTLCNPMDCKLPGSSVHGTHSSVQLLWTPLSNPLQTRILEWVAIPFSRGIFLTQGLNPGLLYCRQILYHLSHQGSPHWKVTDK